MSGKHALRPIALSTIEPLPFWPNLKMRLRSHGAALLLIYLEVHFPAPEGMSDAPVLLDIDRTRHDLVISRWSFGRLVSQIAVGYRSARALRVAQRANREFVTHLTLGAGAFKPYSYVNPDSTIWELRRNIPRLQQLLAECNMPWPIRQSHLCSIDSATSEAFDSFPSDSGVDSGCASGRELALEVSRGLAVLSDGRRQPGLKRRFAVRAKWTEDRRRKFMETMAKRYGWKAKVPENTAKHLSDSQFGVEVSDAEINDLSLDCPTRDKRSISEP